MRLRRSVLSCLLLTGLSLGALSPARAADRPAPGAAGAAVGQLLHDATATAHDARAAAATHEDARESLAEVKDLFAPMTRHEARTKIATGEGKDATLALRDLSLRMGSLSRAERTSAYSDFQRPWPYNPSDTGDGPTYGYGRECAANICVHWIKPGHGDDGASTDDYAHTVLATMVHVSQTYAAAGYRYPRRESGAPYAANPNYFGGSTATDIYLDDVGSQGKYGYCTIDLNSSGNPVFPPPNPQVRGDLPAFCVLDNDFDKSQFPTGHTWLQDLQVTAAHEYFHAVQFGYDFFEDRWFMEATATWAEDQLYDSINDNAQYLSRSQLRYPGVSLDTFGGAGGFLHYGDWLFFEYLTERVPARRGALPVLMLRMWQYADTVSGPDLYSIQAVAAALREKNLSFNRTFAQYAAANQHPATAYSEGRANRYPSGKVRKTFRLRPGNRSAAASYRVNHLAYATTRFVPRHLRSRHTKLTLTLDMAKRRTGSVAVALVFAKSGRITTKMVRLGRAGNGKVRVPFSSRRIARVELVLVNANHAFRQCWVDTPYSCSGVPARNHVLEELSARVS
jgi:hypothetical protein